MKKTKLKWISKSAALLSFSFLAFAGPVYAQEAPVMPITAENNALGIQPYSDILGWRYKTVGDNLYRRLFNYTKGEWETDYWELCP